MYVRLANAWTDPNGSRHRAGDTVEVDNVTLAELEAGGYVTTNEDTNEKKVEPKTGWPGPGDEPPTPPTASTGVNEPSDDDVIKPDTQGWPGAG